MKGGAMASVWRRWFDREVDRSVGDLRAEWAGDISHALDVLDLSEYADWESLDRRLDDVEGVTESIDSDEVDCLRAEVDELTECRSDDLGAVERLTERVATLEHQVRWLTKVVEKSGAEMVVLRSEWGEVEA